MITAPRIAIASADADVDDPNRRALFSLVGAGVAVAGVNAALKAPDETYAAFGTSEQMVQM